MCSTRAKNAEKANVYVRMIHTLYMLQIVDREDDYTVYRYWVAVFYKKCR